MKLTDCEFKRLQRVQNFFPRIDIITIVFMGMKREHALRHLERYEKRAALIK